jgi:lipopolysaccharide/colanic/teichoic acid biosynthesis glycosyltransferase
MYKQQTFLPEIDRYLYSFFLFLIIWILAALSSNKYSSVKEKSSLVKSLTKILLSSGIVLGVISTLMYLFRIDFYSRFVVFGTILFATLTEVIVCTLFYWIETASKAEPIEPDKPHLFKTQRLLITRLIHDKKDSKNLLSDEALQKRQASILSEISHEAFDFIFKYVPLDSYKTYILSTTSHLNIDLLSFNIIDSVVNLKRVNDIRYINKFFESVNEKLPVGGVLVDYFETKNQRKARILLKFPVIINYIFYTFDFLIKRVFPKFKLTKGIYFFLTRGQNRVLTKAETFGRLYSCGFEIIDELETDGHLFFIAVKTKKPFFPEKPTYGPFIQLERVGRNGKIIKVYKLRTMHPYSEFLQEYVYKKEGLQEGGKFKADFRVSNLGKFFRMLWLDELPMLINFLKGDLKIVGVRPLSKHYFNLYDEKFQERRKRYKPGLIPPFYVDNPKTLEEIIASETRYFDAYDKHPFITDFKYFFKALYNIIFKHYRSA